MAYTWSPTNSPSRSRCAEPGDWRCTMMTRFVRTTYLGLLVLATGCDGWKTPSGPPASLDADLRQSLSRWGAVPIGPTPAQPAALGDSDFVAVWQAVMRRPLAIPEYVTKFTAAFPGTPTSELGFQHAATAIAAFETQALTRTDSPFDRYLQHDDAALTSEQKRGALLFFGDKARCSSCHGGPLLGGQSFANAGVPQLGPGVGSGAPLALGPGELCNQESYDGTLRASPLRNGNVTARYNDPGPS